MKTATTSVPVERLDLEKTGDAAQVFLHQQRYDFALHRIPRHKTVLEIGTGQGYFSRQLVEQGKVFTGLEFDPAACLEARDRLQGCGTLVRGDAQTLPFADGLYSAIVVLEVLEHLVDYRKAVREIHRCLKPDGSVVVSVPYRWIGGKSSTNRFHLYEPGAGELVREFARYFNEIEVLYQYFEETWGMTIARVLHVRRFFGLASTYRDLWAGAASAVARIKIGPQGRGLRISLVLVVSGKKAAA